MGINAIVSFLLEIIALIIYACAPFWYLQTNGVVKAVLGVSIVLVIVILWGRYAAPRSAERLSRKYLLLFKLVVFVPAVILIGFKFGLISLALGFTLVAANLAIEYRQVLRS